MRKNNNESGKAIFWVALACAAIVVLFVAYSPARGLAGRLFASLRMQKVQTVNVDLSAFSGPNADRNLQQMMSQMISDKVIVKTNEKDQPASDRSSASELAGFAVQLPTERKDKPELSVTGAHAFDMTVDRARLQAIFTEAGKPDLRLPASLDGATVGVQLPRAVRARYGHCPTPRPADAVTGPPPPSTDTSDCVILSQAPSPTVNIPQGLDVAQLAEIGLELAGMSPSQAQEFLHTVDWKTTLGLSVPRFMRSYEAVNVSGVRGTLLNMAGRRGPTYTLVWAKNGITYSLTGFGNSGDAIALADSMK